MTVNLYNKLELVVQSSKKKILRVISEIKKERFNKGGIFIGIYIMNTIVEIRC